jgi:hypothetical protein
MNTLILLVAVFLMIAFDWWFLFQNQGDTMATLVGVGWVGATMFFFVWLMQAAAEDLGDFFRRPRRR